MRNLREDVDACAKAVLPLLKSRPSLYVTPGWVADRGVPYAEHTISMALKRLSRNREVDGMATYGIPKYAWLPNLAEVLAKRDEEESKKKKRKDMHAGSL